MAYYRTEYGKEKKKSQNGKRRRGTSPRRQPAAWEGMDFDADIVRYLAMVVSLIEGRRVSEPEIRKMLVRAVRQRRIAKRRRIDYLLHYLENNSS